MPPIFTYLSSSGGGFDPNATAFIAAHNTATGSTMGTVQQDAINGFYLRLKGSFTTNGSNLYAKVKRGIINCPIDDSTANAAAFNVDIIGYSAPLTYVGFVAGDFTPNGLTGGTGKYAAGFGLPLANFGFTINNSGFTVYTNSTGNSGINMGNRGLYEYSMSIRPTAGRAYYWAVANPLLSITTTDDLGVYTMQKTSGFITGWKDGGSKTQTACTNSTPTEADIYLHCFNNNGTASTFHTQRMTCYIAHDSLTDNEAADMAEAVQWYNDNVITGGR